MEVAAPGVVAEPRPVVQHLIELSGGEIGNRWKSCHEPQIIRNHRCDLGLLQHDFGNPNPIGVGVVLPGQVAAAVVVEPVKQPLCEPVQDLMLLVAMFQRAAQQIQQVARRVAIFLGHLLLYLFVDLRAQRAIFIAV